MDLIEEYIRTSRVKVPYTFIEAEIRLFDESKYPFRKNLAPLMCETINKELEYERAYISGARSIVLRLGDSWFKAKGIGTSTYNILQAPFS